MLPPQNILPRIGAKLDVAPISDIIEIKSENTFIRTIYAGNAIQTLESVDPIKLITVRSTAFEAAEEEGGSATTEAGEEIVAEVEKLSLALINHYIVTNIYSVFTVLYVVFVSLVKRNIVADLRPTRLSLKLYFISS